MLLTGRRPAGTCICRACADMRLAMALFAVSALDKLLTIVVVSRRAEDTGYAQCCGDPRASSPSLPVPS